MPTTRAAARSRKFFRWRLPVTSTPRVNRKIRCAIACGAARAREAGVDLKLVTGSGPGGRVVKQDLERAVAESRANALRYKDAADTYQAAVNAANARIADLAAQENAAQSKADAAALEIQITQEQMALVSFQIQETRASADSQLSSSSVASAARANDTSALSRGQ